MSDSETVGKQRSPGVELSLNECQALRHLRAAGWSRSELKMAFEISTSALSRHLGSQCSHPNVAAPAPAEPPSDDELRRFRYARDLTQQEAAEMFDVSSATWAGWEQEGRSLHPANARQIRRALDRTDLPESVPDGWGEVGRPGKYSEQEILDTLAYADSVVEALTLESYKAFRRPGMPSLSVIYDRFDSFPRAVELAREAGDRDE